MNSLTYLLVHQTKNRIKDIFKSPGKLIAYALGIVFFGSVLFNSLMAGMPEFGDEYVAEPNFLLLKGIFFGFFCMMFFPTAFAGLKGTSQYGMDDVNFLFVSPIRARTILFYGMVQSFKTIFIGSWFVLFQAAWLRNSFGIGLDGVFLLWVGYVLFAIACQMLSIFLYAMTNGNASRISLAKAIIIGAFVPAGLVFAWHIFTAGGDFMSGINAALASPVLDFTPVVGWSAAGILALITGEILGAVVFLGLVSAFLAALITIIFVKDPDFYEHVAGATQTLFETQRAVEEGDLSAAMQGGKKARVRGTGLGGTGALVFLYKHVRESFRAKRFGLWGIPTLLYVVGAGVFAFFIHNADYTPADVTVITILSTMVAIYFFSSGTEGGFMEIYNHYIYMIPENPLKKWICANMAAVIRVTVEAVLVFGVAAIVARAAPLNFALAAVTYITFSFYSHGSTLAFMRITGIMSRNALLSVVMLAIYIVPLVPGIVFAIIAAVLAPDSWALTAFLVVFAAWQTLVGFVCYVISKSMLHNCDIISLDGVYKSLQ